MSDEAPKLKEPSPEERDREAASADLDDILALRRTPAFTRYFLRRLDEKANPLRRALLTRKMGQEEYESTFVALAQLELIARLLDDDEAGNRSICGRTQPAR